MSLFKTPEVTLVPKGTVQVTDVRLVERLAA